MKIKSTSVSFGVTANLGNFNSVRVEMSIEADLGDGDVSTTIRARLLEQLQDEVYKAIAAVKGKPSKAGPKQQEEDLL